MTREGLIKRIARQGWINARAFVESCDDDELVELYVLATKGEHRAVCPCSSTLVHLGECAGALAWRCVSCGAPMLGLPLPMRPSAFVSRWLTCLEVIEATS
jgi:hypothetical protein